MAKKAAAKLPPPRRWKYFTIGNKEFIALPNNMAGVYPFPNRAIARENRDVDTFNIFDLDGYKYQNPEDDKHGAWRTTKAFTAAFEEGGLRTTGPYKLVPCNTPKGSFPGPQHLKTKSTKDD